MARKRERTAKKLREAQQRAEIENNIRFVVPMPGKSSWHEPQRQPAYRKIYKFTDMAGDYALEDYQAQFLMQREYLID